MKSYVVIGLGRFGTRLACRLYEQGADVLAIDRDGSAVQKIADHVTRAVVVDGKDRDILYKLGVQNCDCAIMAIGSDLASSVLITVNLKTLGVPHVVCKAHDNTYKEVLEKLGADEVILPEQMIADRLSKSLLMPNIIEEIDLSDEYGMLEMSTPSSWRGKSIGQLNVRAKYNVNIIAVRREKQMKVSPSADYIFEENDKLVLLGQYEAFRKLEKRI